MVIQDLVRAADGEGEGQEQDLSRLPTSLRNELPDYLRNEG
ncbi:hypothetical protein ACFCXK_10030 [Streptomyces sp. NPDC056269]